MTSYGDKIAERLAKKKTKIDKKHKLNQKRKAQKEYNTAFKREEAEIIKLMEGAVNHPPKCDCEGCYWWAITLTIMKENRLYKVMKSWKEMHIDEFHRTNHAYRRYALDKRMSREKLIKFLLAQGAPKEQVDQIADSFLAPVSIIMSSDKSTPMGLLRDI